MNFLFVTFYVRLKKMYILQYWSLGFCKYKIYLLFIDYLFRSSTSELFATWPIFVERCGLNSSINVFLFIPSYIYLSLYLSWCVQAFFGDISGLAPDHCTKANITTGFPGGASGKEPTRQCRLDVRHASSIPESGRSPGEGNGTPLQYSCLENPMDRRAGQPTVTRAAQSRIRLKRLSSSSKRTLCSFDHVQFKMFISRHILCHWANQLLPIWLSTAHPLRFKVFL